MSSAAENVPIVSIIAFAADSIPDTSDTGTWRICSGQELDKSDFPDLYNAIGSSNRENPPNNSFYLPTLQGYFLRGVDDRTTGNIDLRSHGLSQSSTHRMATVSENQTASIELCATLLKYPPPMSNIRSSSKPAAQFGGNPSPASSIFQISEDGS
ncbi:hypothetical protein K440DRAFT_636224 [Wilcoxina mikolae CBS 423.85]|nr:hypothetical protein K440DRAFT_636224 [Wilcoxina mikolae CBS 423.85]